MNQKSGFKITVVGDGYVGKTSLLVAYTSGQFPEEYVPTVVSKATLGTKKICEFRFENHSKKINIDGQNYVANLWDTAGQEDYERLRPLVYPNTSCFVLCYSVIDKASFENILSKWIPELRKCQPNTPIILTGTKMDARETVKDKKMIVKTKAGKKLQKKLKNCKFIECSAKDRRGLDDIFTEAIRSSIQKSNQKKHGKIWSSWVKIFR